MKPTRKLPPPKEHDEQVAFVRWFRAQYPGLLIYSIPNGSHLAGTNGQRAAQIARLKAEGMRPGMPDLHIPWYNLYIEMKRQRGGRLSQEQRDVHHHLQCAGRKVIVAKGWEDAAAQVYAVIGR